MIHRKHRHGLVMLKPFCTVLFAAGWLVLFGDVSQAQSIDYATDIKPILIQYCVGCHGEQQAEANVRLESLADLRRGGDSGPLFVPMNATASPLVQVLEGTREPKMPPEDAPQPTAKEIQLIRAWIDQGAKGTDATTSLKEWLLAHPPKNKTKPSKAAANFERVPITALGWLGSDRVLIGQFNEAYGLQEQQRQSLGIEVLGKVHQIRTTSDGQWTVIATGVPGVGGQALLIDASDTQASPKLLRRIEGHRDAILTAVATPDGKIVATGGYDRAIQLWNSDDGSLIRKLDGHNGAIYDLAFDATGQILASASADETIKIWSIATGERLDTFGQCEAEQYAVRFNGSGERVIAAGADRRIRMWRLQSTDKPSVSPMLYSVFAHEGAVTQLQLSPDQKYIATAGEDKSVKLWRADDIAPLGELAALKEIPSGLLWSKTGDALTATTLDGDVVTISVVSALHKAQRESADASRPSPELAHNAPPTSDEPIVEVQEIDEARFLASAQKLPGVCRVQGVLKDRDMRSQEPGDWYALDVTAGEPWLIQIVAAQQGSPMDSSLDIVDAEGQPVLRTRLQAVRETYFTFRGKDSTNSDDFRLHRWEDMELNEYLYAGGEVVKLWLYPRGPDSGFKVYPGFGNRFTYFDTTATTHALNEPAWIVRELGRDEAPTPNGLPVFPVYYSNDDESSRKLGKDSQLTFIAPASGTYYVRVRDARGLSGDAFKYELLVQRPKPRFQFRVEPQKLTLRPGVGTEFSFRAERFDGCEGDILVKVEGLPRGLQISPSLVIQAGHLQSLGTIYCPAETTLETNEFELRLTASSQCEGREISAMESIALPVVLENKPAMPLKIVDKSGDKEAAAISEIVIRPGTTVSARLVIERGKNLGDISFGGDDSGRNLPHGCFIDNIGLNGLLIPSGQSTREFFITAAPWVPAQTRPFHLKAQTDGNPTTIPVMLKVVRD